MSSEFPIDVVLLLTEPEHREMLPRAVATSPPQPAALGAKVVAPIVGATFSGIAPSGASNRS